MKQIITAFLVFFSLHYATAQRVHFGPRASLAYSQIVLTDKSVPYNTKGGSIGYQAGVFVRKDLDWLFFQIETVYTGNIGGNWVYNDDRSKVRAASVGIPLIIGRKFYPNIRIIAGLVPFTSFGLEEDLLDFTPGILDDLNHGAGGDRNVTRGGLAMNMLVGAGMDFHRMTLALQYEGGFAGGFLYDSISPTGMKPINLWHRIPMLSLGVGYRIN